MGNGHTTHDPLRLLEERIDGVVRRNGHFAGLCPVHDDHNPSLEFGWNAERATVWLVCWVCGNNRAAKESILKEIGLWWPDLYAEPRSNGSFWDHPLATWDYTDARGNFLFQVAKYPPIPKEGKPFRPRTRDGSGRLVMGLHGTKPTIYRLPDVMRAVLEGETVYVFEGEKDVDNGRERLGVVGTTSPMGAGNWKVEYAPYFRGADVIVVPDNDKAGLDHAADVGRSLTGVANSVRLLKLPELPEKGDLTDWLDNVGTKKAFFDLDPQPFSYATTDPLGSEFGGIPFKTVADVFEEAGTEADWIIEGLLARGSVTDLSGEPKTSGKTTLAMHALKKVMRGEDFAGFPTRQSEVAYLSEQGNNLKEALQSAGFSEADSSLHIVQHRDVKGRDWAELIETMAQECVNRSIDTLVVDTFAAFTGLAGAEENNSGDIRERMEPLKTAAQAHNLAVLYIRHAGKSGKGRGSSQFEAEGDIILTLKRPEGCPAEGAARVLEGIGRYDIIPAKLTLELTENGYTSEGAGERVKFNKARRKILELAPVKEEEAIKQTVLFEKLEAPGISTGTARRALKWMVERDQIRRKDKPVRYWRPGFVTLNTGMPPNSEGEETVVAENSKAPKLVDTEDRVSEVVDAVAAGSEIALDTETTGLDVVNDRVRLLSLRAGDETFLVDCFAVNPEPVLEALKDKSLYIHNAEFDLPRLWHAFGFAPVGDVVDTQHLSRVARAGEWEKPYKKLDHGLAACLERELGITVEDKKRLQKSNWAGELTEEQLYYAESDVLYLEDLAQVLLDRIAETGQGRAWDIEMRAKPMVLEMCRTGVPFDRERCGEALEQLKAEESDEEERFKEVARVRAPHPEGEDWNVRATGQLLRAFEIAGLKLANTNKDTLKKHADEPLAAAVLGYRKAKSALNSARGFHSGPYKYGRLYPTWNPSEAATGRMSCSSPPLQNMPKSGPLRACVKARDGWVLVKSDLSQIELRVLAAFTGDENMIHVFRTGGDIHSATAEAVSGRPAPKGSPERDAAKCLIFGISYGMGSETYRQTAASSYGVDMTQEEAEEALGAFFRAYPEVEKYHDRVAEQCRRQIWEVHSMTGRRRKVSPDKGRPKFTEAVNHPIQATALDVLKVALAKLYEDRDRFPDAVPILTVHDELVYECPEGQAKEVGQWIEKAFSEAVEEVLGMPELAGPGVVSTSISKSWGGD